ncbi:hypothetical protein MHU86_22211 [Fragilaria crotonensis]|nr:hypothetical protein MHU86_22211 [Fragilaria crotonensis]
MMASILLVSMLLQCFNLQVVQATSLKSSSYRNRGLGPRGTSLSSSSRLLNGVQDANFERRKERHQKGRQLKCKDQFVSHQETPTEIFMFVDCLPSGPTFPTFSPTTTPVPSMTAFPSVRPATSPVPTLPTEPTIPTNTTPPSPTSTTAPFPTNTTAPTPTYAPFVWSGPVSTDMEFEAACRAAQNGQVYNRTNVTVEVSFLYELLVSSNSSSSFNTVVDQLERNIGSYLAKDLVPCQNDTVRQRNLEVGAFVEQEESSQNHPSSRRQLLVRGVGPGVRDLPVDGAQCQVLVESTTADGYCYAMEGTITLYLSDADDMTTEEASVLVYEKLKTAFNGNNNTDNGQQQPQYQGQFVDESAGILGLYFYGASLPTDGAKPSGEVPAKAEQASQVDDSGSLGGLGIGFIAAACFSVVVLALFVTRKRRRQLSNKNKGRGIEVGDNDDMDTFNSSPRTPAQAAKTSWEDNDDDDNGDALSGASLPAEVVSNDGSSIFHDIDLDGGFHMKYINGTGVLDQGVEVAPTFVKTTSAPYKAPSAYKKRRRYGIPDTVEL